MSSENRVCKQFLLNKAVKIMKLKINQIPGHTDNIINATYILCTMINKFVDDDYEEIVGKFCLDMENVFLNILTNEYFELAQVKNIMVQILKNNFLNTLTPLDFIWNLVSKIDQYDTEVMRVCRLLLTRLVTNRKIYKYDYSTIGVSLFIIACFHCNKMYDVPINVPQKISNIGSCQKEIIISNSDVLPNITIEDIKLFSTKFTISFREPTSYPNIKLIDVSSEIKDAPIIGEGSFGKVRKILVEDKPYAVKIFDEVEHCLKELAIISKLSHPNISGCLSFSQIGKNIVYKYANCSLNKYLVAIKEKGIIMSNDLIQSYSFQLAKAIEYCHSKRIAHLDIKPSNILLYANGDLQLTDFGSSMFIHYNYQGYAAHGHTTATYTPPEYHNLGKVYDPFATDMWSLGCVIYEMLTLDCIVDPELCDEIDNDNIEYEAMVKDKILDLKTTGISVEKDAQDLVFGLLELDFNKRMKIADVLNNNFVKAIIPRLGNRF